MSIVCSIGAIRNKGVIAGAYRAADDVPDPLTLFRVKPLPWVLLSDK